MASVARGVARAAARPWMKVGGERNGFIVKQIFPVSEFDLIAYHLEHKVTKAKYVHIDCDDTNNVFCVAFRTPVNDSTGVPHILEHTVLCGSETFPVRDPFFYMIKRSLNTFMNALTASDYTMYPFATRNEQDFKNLLRVYLDAAFFPKLRETDFLQEGHRLEFDPEDENSLIRTGVVYNEMKGTLGNAATLFHHELHRALLPGTPYSHISGGDPPNIGDLTHQELVAFHQKHYHPTNALFYTYGDMPLENHMDSISELVLGRFQYSDSANKVKSILQSSKIEPSLAQSGQVQRVSGPPEPMQDFRKQTKVVLSRVIEGASTSDEYLAIKARILGMLLLDGPGAPLYASLIDSQVAPDFSPGTGFDNSTMHPSFGIGVQGVSGDDETIENIRSTIEKTLSEVAQTGFDERRVQAVLHQLELSLKHKQTNFGLSVMYALTGSFAHAVSQDDKRLLDVMNESITVNGKLQRLVSEMKENPRFWQEEVARMFFEDPTSPTELRKDFITLAMSPSDEFTEKLRFEESKELQQVTASMTPQKMEDLRVLLDEFQADQEKPQDVSCLPTLKISDVPRIPEEIVEVDPSLGVDGENSLIWVENQTTNGIVYIRAFFDTSHVPDEVKPMLGLFTSFLGSVDTAKHSYQDLSTEMDLRCSGININPSVISWYGGGDNIFAPTNQTFHKNQLNDIGYRQGVMVTTSALAGNLDATLDLARDMLTSSDFERNVHHIESLLATELNNVSSSVTNSSLGYARKFGQAPLLGEYALREGLSGLSYVELVQKCAGDVKSVIPILQYLLQSVFRADNMTMCVVAGGSGIDKPSILGSVKDGLVHGSTPDDSHALSGGIENAMSNGVLTAINERDPARATYIPLPVSVHNCTAAVPTPVSFGHDDEANMMILAQLASSNFMHKHIREKGGAYGGGCSHDMNGLFQMYSYYDPQSEETLRTFSKATQWLCDGSFSDRDIDEALLSTFGSIDAPQEVRTKGSGAFLYGITQDQRQRLRDRFFEVDRKKLVEAANRHLGHLTKEDTFLHPPFGGNVAVAGSTETTFANNAEGWDVKNL